MAKVILTCGRLCSGKTTYAKKLCQELPAVHYSIDELTMLLLGPYPGDILDEYFEKLEGYFYSKAAETAKSGINAVIDVGLWTKDERTAAREYFKNAGAECEIHYIKVADSVWKERIERRNADIEAGRSNDYYVDGNLFRKFETMFEEPQPEEIDATVGE